MTRNVTLRMDETILRKCRHEAVEKDQSLSQWITDQIFRIISRNDEFQTTRTRSVKRLAKGYHLGGIPIKREKLYER